MPDSCCAPLCAERREKGSELSFYTIPSKDKHEERRAKWINAIKRDKWPEKSINNARICGKHFVSGKPSMDPLNVDYVPSVFSFKIKLRDDKQHQNTERYERHLKRRKTETTDIKNDVKNADEENENNFDDGSNDNEDVMFEITDSTNVNDKGTQTDFSYMGTIRAHKLKIVNLNKARAKLVVKNRTLKSQQQDGELRYDSIKKDIKKFKFYTGLMKLCLFDFLIDLLSPVATVCKKLSPADHILAVLIKVRLGLMNKDIAYRFGVTEKSISNIFRQWLPALANALDFLIIWPGKEALMENIPKCFRKSFKKCSGIIDCTEIFICKPSAMEQKAVTWSSYKNSNTIKYLICITPSGAISFISNGWSGRVSDKHITLFSGFMKRISRGDLILADRGFTVAEEIAQKGAVLQMPAFTTGRNQLAPRDVDQTRKLANVRIHVERVIGRMRKFSIMNGVLPISIADMTDEIIRTIAALVNLNRSVVNKK